MTQSGLLGLVFGLRGRITSISWLDGQDYCGSHCKANYRAKLEYSPAEEENSRYPKHCIWQPSLVNT
jgi:hypothetical protein